MAGETVLIVAFSGRSLAQSARRAGYRPLVVDAFGDADMRAAADAFRTVERAAQIGFRTKPLLAALDALVANASSPPIGLVLGSGLEDKLRLVEVLDKRYRLIGCSVEALRTTKDPQIFFAVLDQLGIAHPHTRMTPPTDHNGWISKRIGGSGGRHIRDCTANMQARPRRYFQQHIDGERISISALVADGIGTDMTRQWCRPSRAQPYRYGGAVSIPFQGTKAERTLLGVVDQVSRAFQLKGLVSFDFVVAGDVPYLLEVNPRPGASLDVIDTPEGSRFHAHVAACRDGTLDQWGGTASELATAAAILHADRGALTLAGIDWPVWAADRGVPGSIVVTPAES